VTSYAVDPATEHRRRSADDMPLRWWSAPKDKTHSEVWEVARRIRQGLRPRERKNFYNSMLYNDIDLTAAPSYADARYGTSRGDLSLNVIQNAIDTAQSMIAKNRPKPLFLPDGADYKLRTKCKKLTKYVAGVFDDAKIHDVAASVFIDSCVYGTGALKWFADPRDKRVRCERVFIGEIVVDDLEGFRETPSQLHQYKLVSRDQLLAQFPKHKDAILKCQRDPSERRSSHSIADVVPVLESWHLPSGPGEKDGLHTIVIQEATLFREEYDRDYYPIQFFRWYPSTHGFWGRGVCQSLAPIQRTINRILRSIEQGALLVGAPLWLIDKAAHVNWDQLLSNEVGRGVLWNSSGGAQPPAAVTPPALADQIFGFLWQLVEQAYRVVGVNAPMSAGMKQPGVESGAAIRETSDIASGRFQVISQRWEAFHVEAAHIVVDLSRELHKDTKGDLTVAVRAENDNALEVIRWRDVDMERDRYKITVFPISGLPQTPQGRIEQLTEWFAMQIITRQQLMELMQLPDMKAAADLETATLRLTQTVVSVIKDEDRYDDELHPIPQMDVPQALKIVTDEIVLAKLQACSESVMAKLELYAIHLNALAPPPPPPQAPPGPPPGPPGPPGAGPPPGAPPGPPGPPPPPMAPPMAA
jgi:hypothetical protein